MDNMICSAVHKAPLGLQCHHHERAFAEEVLPSTHDSGAYTKSASKLKLCASSTGASSTGDGQGSLLWVLMQTKPCGMD